jgi:hypothetical protein
MTEPCPQGRTDYEACFAPFRYCPVKGCGRVEAEHPVEAVQRLELAEACRMVHDFANMLETTPSIYNQNGVVAALRLLVAHGNGD